MTKVGDTIYCMNQYSSRSDGRNQFSPHVIAGETKFSWLVNRVSWGDADKINKKTMQQAGRNGFGATLWFTADGKQEWLFTNKYARDIGTAVQAADMDTLKKIADIIGYNWKDKS